MTTLFALILCLGLTPHYAGVWPRDFGGPKKPHQQISTPAAQTVTVRPTAPRGETSSGAGPKLPGTGSVVAQVAAGSQYLSGKFVATPEGVGFANELIEHENEARKALADLRPIDAVKWLTKPGKFLPKGSIVDANLLFDAYLWSGRLDDAYDLMAGMPLDNTASEETLLRASLVAALRGEVYKGQREYVMSVVNRFDGNKGAGWVPDGYSPKSIAVLSAIMVSGSASLHNDAPNRFFYISEALKLDPTSSAAAGEYAYIMIELGHYKEATRALMGAMDAAEGFDKFLLKDKLQMAQWYLNHPNAKSGYHYAMRDPFPNMK